MSNFLTNFLDKIFAALLLIITLPILLLSIFLIKITTHGPTFFIQKRVGKDKKIFEMIKLRTMIVNAEKIKKRYMYLNDVKGPFFKIIEDPRFTSSGRFLSHTGIDELPQLVNVLKGDMALIGPRPLPIEEVKKIPIKYNKRFSVLPGITSLWIVKGGHELDYKIRLKLDIEYVDGRSFFQSVYITYKTVFLVIKKTFLEIFRNGI